jgi:hypothetical protein
VCQINRDRSLAGARQLYRDRIDATLNGMNFQAVLNFRRQILVIGCEWLT